MPQNLKHLRLLTSKLKVIEAGAYRRSDITNQVIKQPNVVLEYYDGAHYAIRDHRVLYHFLQAHVPLTDSHLRPAEVVEWCTAFDLKILIEDFIASKNTIVGVWIESEPLGPSTGASETFFKIVDIDTGYESTASPYYLTAFEMIKSTYFDSSVWSMGTVVGALGGSANRRAKIMVCTNGDHVVEIVVVSGATYIIGRHAYKNGYVSPYFCKINCWLHLIDAVKLNDSIEEAKKALHDCGTAIKKHQIEHRFLRTMAAAQKISLAPILTRARIESEFWEEIVNSFCKLQEAKKN
jgi:hypothetical protein